MKTTIPVALAVVVLLGLACSQTKTADPLNYDDLILLDAEELAAGGIKSEYAEMAETLKRYVDSPAEVFEEFDDTKAGYRVSCLGKDYPIYADDMLEDEGQSWGNATVAFFDIVNRQLVDSEHKFYAFYGGNDLGGMFLTDEQYATAIKIIDRKLDWPFIPKMSPPTYGQPYD